MNGHTPTCPDDMQLQAFADDRDETLTHAERDAIDLHVESCETCTEELADVRRFRTLLLRTRVPTLDDAQWDMLDERVAMMSAEPPPRGGRVVGRIYWGVAVAAAISLVAVGVWRLAEERPDTPTSVLSRGGQDRVAGAFTAVALTVAEGSVELAGADGRFAVAKPGQRLERGAQLRSLSGAKSGRLVVAGNFELTLAPETLVSVEAGNGREVFLRLRHGSVACQVAKRRPGQRFGVLAGGFRASVVGTEFVVRHDVEGRVSVSVTEGAVRVDEADGPWREQSETTMMVRAGNRWEFAGGHMQLGPITPAWSDSKRGATSPHASATDADGPRGTQRAAAGATAATRGAQGGAAQPVADRRPTTRASGQRRARAAREGRAARLARRDAAARAAAAPQTAPEAPTLPDAKAAQPAAAPAATPHVASASDLPPTAPPPALPEPIHTQDGKGADGKRIVIEVPHQRMSPEEIERAKRAERRGKGHGAVIDRDAR